MSRILQKALTINNAPELVGRISCELCDSMKLDILSGFDNDPIVLIGRSRCCTECGHYIPFRFSEVVFPLADFCPNCVRLGRVDDTRIENASRTKGLGDAFTSIAFWFHGDDAQHRCWLRRAIRAGDEGACFKLANVLSTSKNPEDISEARDLYTQAVALTADRQAEYYLALMLISGRGGDQDIEHAVRLMESSGEKGAWWAWQELGDIFLNGRYVVPDAQRAFDCYSRALTVYDKDVVANFAMWIMLRRGIGVPADLSQAQNHLEKAVLRWSESSSLHVSDERVTQLEEIERNPKVDPKRYPLAREFLDNLAGRQAPFASELLDRCGGPTQRESPRQDHLFLLRLKLRKMQGQADIWQLKSTLRDRVGHSSLLGQVERASGGGWMATTLDGEPLLENHKSLRTAALALARHLNCAQPLILGKLK